MREYAVIMLNVLEYVCIYLNRQSFEYASILNVSDAVHITRPLFKLLSTYRDRISEYTLKNLR